MHGLTIVAVRIYLYQCITTVRVRCAATSADLGAPAQPLGSEATPAAAPAAADPLYQPKVSTWGAFPRPNNISEAYGGGRNLVPGQVGPGCFRRPPNMCGGLLFFTTWNFSCWNPVSPFRLAP